MTRWSAKRWLRDFRAVGGMAWIPAGKRVLSLAWMVEDRSDEEQAKSRALYREIDASPRRCKAVARIVGATS